MLHEIHRLPRYLQLHGLMRGMPRFDRGHQVGISEENVAIINSGKLIRNESLTTEEEVELEYQALMQAGKEGKVGYAFAPSSKKIAEGLHINWMSMRDAETEEELWQSEKWEKCFDEELCAEIPERILDCDSVSREINFTSEEEIEKFRLEQRVLLNRVCLEEWFFDFGFVIKNSTNTWQQTINAAKGHVKSASELSGKITFETSFFDGHTLLCRALVRIFYV